MAITTSLPHCSQLIFMPHFHPPMCWQSPVLSPIQMVTQSSSPQHGRKPRHGEVKHLSQGPKSANGGAVLDPISLALSPCSWPYYLLCLQECFVPQQKWCLHRLLLSSVGLLAGGCGRLVTFHPQCQSQGLASLLCLWFLSTVCSVKAK
jgi:hypothetical protein